LNSKALHSNLCVNQLSRQRPSQLLIIIPEVVQAHAVHIVVRLDSFPIAIFLHRLPDRRGIVALIGGLPVFSQEILHARNWQAEGELAPRRQDWMIITGERFLFFEVRTRAGRWWPQQDRRYEIGIVPGCKGGEGVGADTTRIAQYPAVGIAATVKIDGRARASCREQELERYQCLIFHHRRHH
jgi:hypothetical protein